MRSKRCWTSLPYLLGGWLPPPEQRVRPSLLAAWGLVLLQVQLRHAIYFLLQKFAEEKPPWLLWLSPSSCRRARCARYAWAFRCCTHATNASTPSIISVRSGKTTSKRAAAATQ